MLDPSSCISPVRHGMNYADMDSRQGMTECLTGTAVMGRSSLRPLLGIGLRSVHDALSA